MANTRDTLGDQETLDALLTDTLEELEEDGVSTLNQYAFTYFNNLKVVRLPNLTVVPQYAFYNNTSIETVDLPNATTLNNYCFQNSKIKNINAPNVTRMDEACFQNCDNLQTINLPNIVSTTYQHILRDCDSLEEINFQMLKSVAPYFCYLCKKLKTINLPSAENITNYAFYGCDLLDEINIPKVKTIGQHVFSNCKSITDIELPALQSLSAYSFYQCTKLKHVVLSGSELATTGDDTFRGTPIYRLQGVVYVPEDMVQTYKGANNWKKLLIAPTSDYPLSNSGIIQLLDQTFGTISDSWSEIIANTTDYATRYPIGSKKAVDFGTYGGFLMELVAINADDKADGSGKARMTWICNKVIREGLSGNYDRQQGWVVSNIKSFLINQLMPQIQEDIRNSIVPVNKTYLVASNSASSNGQTLISSESIWIPSAREIFGETGYEDSGVTYSSYYNTNNSRIKNNDAESRTWITRSIQYNSDRFWGVGPDGRVTYTYISGGIVPGFCI